MRDGLWQVSGSASQRVSCLLCFAPEDLVIPVGTERRASGAKARGIFGAFSARLKSCPDTKRLLERRSASFSAACEVAPFQSSGFFRKLFSPSPVGLETHRTADQKVGATDLRMNSEVVPFQSNGFFRSRFSLLLDHLDAGGWVGLRCADEFRCADDGAA